MSLAPLPDRPEDDAPLPLVLPVVPPLVGTPRLGSRNDDDGAYEVPIKPLGGEPPSEAPIDVRPPLAFLPRATPLLGARLVARFDVADVLLPLAVVAIELCRERELLGGILTSIK